MSQPKRIILVFGATGAQGRSVALSLSRSPSFHVRGTTRSPDSERAKPLKDAGIEVVKADGFNKAEIQDALKGAWGLFLNTNTEDKSLDEGRREAELGKLVLDVAKEAGVEMVVYSTLPPAKELSNGEIEVLSCDSKNAIKSHASTLGFKSAAFILPGWYMENFATSAEWARDGIKQGQKAEELLFGGFPGVPDEDGVLTMKYPDIGDKEGVPLISIEDDFGDLVHGLFLDPEKNNGKVVQAVGELLSFQDIVTQFTEVTGRPARFIPIDVDSIPTDSFFLRDLVQTWKLILKVDGKMFGAPVDVETSKALKRAVKESLGSEDGTRETAREMKRWKEWVKVHLM